MIGPLGPLLAKPEAQLLMHPLHIRFGAFRQRLANYLRLRQHKPAQQRTETLALAAPPSTFDVTANYDQLDLERLAVLRSAPVWMTGAERLMLYALVYTLRPQRYLEIGTFRGGSALIVATAMDALGYDGKIICLDPQPLISPEDWARISHRARLVHGFSPSDLSKAAKAAGGRFDFVLIDGDHSYASVRADAQGVLPFLTDQAYVVFHDAFHADVQHAVNDFVSRCEGEIYDCGFITREVTGQSHPSTSGDRWCGLRLVQLRRHDRE